MTVVGQAIVAVRPDMAPFKRDAEKGVSGLKTKPVKVSADTAGFKKSLGGITKTLGLLGAGLATAKVAGFFKSSVGAASDLSESLSKARVVFGSSSGAVEKFAKTAASSLGLSQQAALEATGTFGNLLTALGLGQKPAADMSQKIVTLAGDLASFNNVNPEDALLALRAGLTGEAEPLKKFGVNLNEATLKAKALAMGIGDGKKPLDAASKAQAAYALIMEQTKTAQGDFTRTSGGLANQQRILAARITDLKAKIGGALLPVVLKITGVFQRFIGIISGNPVEIAKLKASLIGLGIPIYDIADAVGAFITRLREMLPTFSQVQSAVGTIVGYIVRFKEAIIAGVAAAATVVSVIKVIQLVKAAWIGLNAAFAISPIGLIVIGVAALAAGFVIAYQRIEAFRNAVNSVVAVVLPLLQQLVAFVQANFVPFMVAAWEQIRATAMQFVAWFQGTAMPVIRSVFTQIGTIVRTVAPIIGAAINAAVAVAKTAWSWFGGPMVTILKAAFQAAMTYVRTVMTVISNTIQLILNVIHGRWGAAWNNIKTIVSTTLRAAVSIIGTLGGAFLSAAAQLAGKVLTGLKNKLAQAPSVVLGLLAKIPGFLVGLQGALLSAGLALGKQIIQGLINGMEALAGAVLDKARSIANSVKDTIAGALHIGSPSKVMHEMGRDTVQGFINGIDSLTPKLKLTVSQAVKDAVMAAKQNLSGLAQSLAGSVNAVLDAQLSNSPAAKALKDAQSKQGALDLQAQIDGLNATINDGAASEAERAKASADLAVLMAQQVYDAEQNKVQASKDANDRILADLAQALNRGLITQADYQKKVTDLLASEGVNYKTAGDNLGLAFADGFLTQLNDMLDQARAVVRAGLPDLNGLSGGVTDPIATVRGEITEAQARLNELKKGAKDKSGPGGKKITAAEKKQIDTATAQLKALRELRDAMDQISQVNINVGQGVDAAALRDALNAIVAAATR